MSDLQNLSYIPLEILVDIFVRLPARTLLRCKSVCKLWNKQLSDPNFTKQHVHHSLTTKKYLRFIHENPSDSNFRKFDVFDSHQLRGECRGLLYVGFCCYSEPSALYNPSTQTYRLLPRPPLSNNPLLRELCGGEFVFGFGYDSKSEDYKIVRVIQSEEEGIFDSQVVIYSFNNHSWKLGPSVPNYFNGIMTDGRSYANIEDNVHWIDHPKRGEAIEDVTIITFNLSSETFGSLIFPTPYVIKEYSRLFVWELHGCLCVSIDCARSYRSCDVWIMKEYGVAESWTHVYRYPEEDIRKPYISPFSYSMNGKEVFATACNYSYVDPIYGETLEECEKIISSDLYNTYSLISVENLIMLEDAIGVHRECKTTTTSTKM